MLALVRWPPRFAVVFSVAASRWATGAGARAGAPACPDGDAKGKGKGPQLWIAPLAPVAGKPLRVMVVAPESLEGAEVSFSLGGTAVTTARTEHRGGAPISIEATVDKAAAGHYKLDLLREALRPASVLADPYGHVLMLAKWIDQGKGQGKDSGMLLAVDGQPDGSVGRKRFWEGNFLYANDVAGAGPGRKAFRPLGRGSDGKLAPLSNAALRADPRCAPFSTEQAELSRDAFYVKMGKIINPRGLEAATAYGETLDTLPEQLQTRVGSVDNGEKYMRENHAPVVPMPDGAKIIDTVGPCEDYATPSRDKRLLIAIHVLETLPERITAHPELFNMGGRKPAVVRAEVEALHAARAKERSIQYQRSDGPPFKLPVADVLARKTGFEMSYNPNDCVETRWAAPAGSAEASTCKRQAPDAQRKKMAEYRPWFHDMRRPARGRALPPRPAAPRPASGGSPPPAPPPPSGRGARGPSPFFSSAAPPTWPA